MTLKKQMITTFYTPAISQLLLTCLMIIGPLIEASSQEYFQQEVNYKINVTLNDKLHELNAFEAVEYINNSPDTLQYLYFHLWPNGYSNNKTALAGQLFDFYGKEKLFNDPELRGSIDSLEFKVNGHQVQWNLLTGQPDICQIILNEPLLASDTINITTPFHVKIPKGVTSRLGHIGDSYQISQWYPKPAVYDRSGWHQMPFLDQGEFYSEFGCFDVSITLPDNYIVGATGDLQNDREADFLDSLATDTTWIKNTTPGKDDFPASSPQTKTLRYTENMIHDFAWFADKRFHVSKGKVKLPDSGREVTTWAMFTNEQSELWKDAIQYMNDAMLSFSEWIGDYPYNSFTAVQSALNAGSGMEYPGITVIGIAENAYSLDEVITHELVHNWFYSALGTDERRYPYLDEGIASAYTARYMKLKYPEKKLWDFYLKKRKLAAFFHIDKMPVQLIDELEWLIQARGNLEQPIDIPATDFTYLNYDVILYYKAGQGFNYLQAYLGDSIFDSAMHRYYLKYKYSHPTPDDLRNSYQSNSDKNLDWFFNDYLGTAKRLDYKIIRSYKQRLLVKNNGELASPLLIAGMRRDSICFEKWVDGFEGKRWIDIPDADYSELKIDPNHETPELYRLNNNIRKSGIFRKSDPLRCQLFFTLEDPDKRSVIYFPSANWTRENGFMLGVTLHNGTLLPKPFEYFLMPYYSFNNPGLAGFGRIAYNITPFEKIVRMATISLEGTQYGAPGNQNYRKVNAGLDLYFRPENLNNHLLQKVFGNYIAASDLYQIELLQKAKMISYLQFGYQLEKSSKINPFKLLASFESSKTFQKTSVEFNYKHSYTGKNNGLGIRLFTGIMLKTDPNVPFYAFSASGRSGCDLYLYEGTYPDRFEEFPTTFFSRQMTLSEGGLITPVKDIGYSNWLISSTLTSSLPGKAGRIPIKPFVNFLLNDPSISPQSPFFFEAGLKASIWNFFEIYVPLVVSENIKSSNESLKDRIRFVFNLDILKMMKLSSVKDF